MRPRVFVSVGLALALALAVAAPVAAQDFESLFNRPLHQGVPPRAPNQFGGSPIKTVVPSQSFVPLTNASVYASTVTGYHFTTQGPVFMWAPLEVPIGASVEEVCLEVFDNNDATFVAFIVVGAEAGSAGNPAPGIAAIADAQTPPGGAGPGYVSICAVANPGFSFPFTVRTKGNLDATGTDTTLHYYLIVLLPTARGADDVMAGPAVVTWSRVVTAPPPTPTFSDVPATHIFRKWIEALAVSGITGGCDAGPPARYCPAEPITRGQMAVFVAQALGLYYPD
jgi:hypothetical protein